MAGNKNWFSDLEKEFNRTVKHGNNTRMTVTVKGSIKIQLNGITHVISNVYYIPELKNNLLSIRQHQDKGLTILMDSAKYFILRDE